MFSKLNFFSGYFQYLAIFRRYIGNKIFFLFALSLVAVAADSLGIMMLLPLLKLSELTEGGLGGKAALLIEVLDFMGLPRNQVGVVAFIVLAFTLKGCVKFGENVYRTGLIARMQRRLRSRLLNHYTRMEYIFYSSKNTGHFINIINIQITRFLKSFTAITEFSAQMITTGGYLLFALFLSWPFTLMALVCGGCILFLFRTLTEFSRNLSFQVSRENTVWQKLLVQMLHAMKYLSATASVRNLENNAQASITRLTRMQFKLGVAGAFTGAVKEPIAVIFLSLLLLVQIAVLHQPLGPIFIALILFYRAMGAIISIQGAWQRVMNAIGGFEMVREEFEAVEANAETSGHTPTGDFSKGVCLEGVSFSYTHDPVLKDINLSIRRNSTVAIVGASGAGKSTLADLVTLLLKPGSGKVSIDGVPHNQLDLHQWRSQIGFVSQETVVFDDTVANNISLWTCDYEKDDICKNSIEKAARRAYCHPFIAELPQRYQTIVGDKGVKLSGGQRQRLFIARELFKKPRLLILDEATSALDTQSERYIQKSIDELRGKMTVIIIAHRLSTIKNADYIYVLDHGRIIEEGAYDELLGRDDSKLGKMVAMQRL